MCFSFSSYFKVSFFLNQKHVFRDKLSLDLKKEANLKSLIIFFSYLRGKKSSFKKYNVS